MTSEQFVGILPVLVAVAVACIFLWVKRDRPGSAPATVPATVPAADPVEDEGEVVAAVAGALCQSRLAPAAADQGETVAAIAAALRRQG